MPDPWGDTSGTSYGYNPNNNSSAGTGFWGSLRNWFTGSGNTDTSGGGGGGGGIGFGGGAKTAATAATKTSSMLPWLQFALAVIEGQRSGKFQMPPMTPEQQQMLKYAMGILQGTPQQSSYMMPILGYDLGHPATLDMEALKRGDVGFTPAGHMPADELARVLSRAQSPPATTDTTGDGSGGSVGGESGFDRGEHGRPDSLYSSLRHPQKY